MNKTFSVQEYTGCLGALLKCGAVTRYVPDIFTEFMVKTLYNKNNSNRLHNDISTVGYPHEDIFMSKYLIEVSSH